MTVSARMTAGMSITNQADTAILGSKASWAAQMDYLQSIADGTIADQADLAYMAERTVGDGADDDIDLSGVLADALGDTLLAAELVAVQIINKQKDGTANTTSLTVGAGSNTVPGFAAALAPIEPGGMFMQASAGAAGLATITAGTGDIIRVTNGAGAANTYQIGLLMRSA